LYPVLLTAGKIVAAIALLGTSNIFLIGGAGYYYWKYTSDSAKKELELAASKLK
jgi:hypothetical protein